MFDFGKLSTGKKIVKILLLLLGVALLAYGIVSLLMDGALNGSIVAENGLSESNNEGLHVIATGKLTAVNKAEDPEFHVSVNDMALYRKVEMVQYVQDKTTGEVKLVFSDRQEPSFKDASGKTYTNAIFPRTPVSQVFTGGTTIGDGTLAINASFLLDLTEDNGLMETPAKLTEVGDLPPYTGRDGLESYGTFYASPGEEWKVGDVRVTFYSFHADPDKAYTVAGTQRNGMLYGGASNTGIWDHAMEMAEIRQIFGSFRTTGALIALALGSGIFLIGLAVGASFIMPWEKVKDKKK